MADQANSIFNQKATEKLKNPDDLDKHVRVTSARVWIVLAACIVFLIGLFAWSMLGTVTTNISTRGVCVDGKAMCFLPSEKAARVHVGDKASVSDELMTVASISTVPVSRDEARDIVGSDYLASTLVEGDWAFVVRFDDDGDHALRDDKLLPVSITTERVAPISLFSGKNDE